MDLQAAVEVSYNYTLPDNEVSTYVETYPKVSIADIGGLVVLTDQALGAIGAVSPLGSGVAAATHTVGTGTIDPNLHFDVFQPSANDQNLLYPAYYPGVDPNAKLLNRTVQLSPQSFTMTDGTVTFTIFIARFNNNGSAQYADPQLKFYAGLPGYQGFRSFVTIPFTNVQFGALPTSARLTSPVTRAVIDGGLDSVTLTSHRPGPERPSRSRARPVRGLRVA